MNHKFVPASRLTIIFIFAVVLSGSVLTWFSINNISNLKELTEKRILEEQRELSARLSEEIRNKLEKVIKGYDKEIIRSDLLKDSILKSADKYDFITQSFILDKNGRFMYPNFSGITEDKPPGKLYERFISGLSEGEKAEFTERNFLKAKYSYLICLRNSFNANDSSRALMLLGRISVKSNAIDDALNFYILIISEYYHLVDDNGIPYVNYAIPQLLKVSNKKNADKILPVVESYLEKMENGIIPMNYNTEEILDLVTAWIKDNTIENNEKSENLNKLTRSIKQQVQFVSRYGNELLELMRNEKADYFPVTLNGYKVVNSISGENPSFFLINTNIENPAGFLIDRKKLLDTIAKTDFQSGFEFDYKIEFPAEYSSNTTGDNLVYTSQLNSLFPDQLIEIKLNNENLIKDLIKRRAWIYGIASVLLLVAMLLGVVLILRDIAREKHLARLRSDFISNVTHELKTPLTSIRMYAESLMRGRVKSDSEQKEYLSVVVNETDRLKRMINNILEFSKMEKGKPVYHFINSNLALILRETLQEMDYWLEKEQFDVVTELDDTIYAEVDSEKLKQAISNLLSNAIKYSTDIKKISVRLYRKPNHICIEVEDRGVGIPEDKVQHIFEPYYRVEQSDNISGTGLGLTVVKEIIEAHNATISVISKSGNGSRFVVILPTADCQLPT